MNEILAKLRLERQDLNRISSSQLRSVFSDLTVKEISILCGVSKKFNTICKEESFWRTKVLDNYGIEKKYGDTWRQTAINMDKVNMINLGDKWIDGRTYREILGDTVQNGAFTILDLQFFASYSLLNT
uniref:F-box family protein n=1 Tax=Pithovirus LCPAC406 TaxID=2506599 RepID=A0A481ZFX8_9VIRU|nr:MAG: F-box family protein [Pithovirus LCPAC406]